MNGEVIEMHGVIKEVLPNRNFLVELDSGAEILAYPSIRLNLTFIRIKVGDNVTVEMSPYDLTKGRITFRHKG